MPSGPTWLKAPFHFTPGPVSVLVVLIYAIIFASVLYTDELYDVPKNTKGLDVDRAYADLHQITARPHPYLSHANDDVRAYLLSQLEPIAAQHEHVHLSNDLTSNASFVAGGALAGQTPYGIYFEGTNLLVKIDGTDAAPADRARDGVLFSAHYDSVSTAPGATDDGMGVVALVELARYLAQPAHRPRRTAVFFWNNGEEDGLNGAYTYWKHPWSNLTDRFINLEGAASGGRPVLFRSTSQAVTRAFASKDISHLQADVLTGDAFRRGVIRSGTDYQVYSVGLKGETGVRAPMQGLDVAFYKNRAFYHSPRDSIPGMGYGAGRKALWAMLETARGAGLALLNDDATAAADGAPGVYFDLFRTKLVTFSMQALFVGNVVLLVVGPIVTTVLLVFVVLATKKSEAERAAADEAPENKWQRVRKTSRVVLGWGRFWVALIIGILAHVGLVAGYIHINPYVVHAHPYLVLTASLALAYLALAGPLQLLQLALPTAPSAQKLVLLLQHYLLTWVLLAAATAQVRAHALGGVYWVSAWNLSAGLALAAALGEGWRVGAEGRKAALDLSVEDDRGEAGPRLVRGVRYDAPEGGEDAGEVETEPTEITPLMHQQQPERRAPETGAAYDEYGWWILQLVLAVPAVVTLLFQLQYLLLQALMNTLTDGSSALTVYASLSALSLLIFLPVTPFAHRLHHWLTLVVLVVFAFALMASWTVFPFSQERPYKVFFQQQVEINMQSSSHHSPLAVTSPVADAVQQSAESSTPDIRVWTSLSGVSKYLTDRIIPELPSSWGKDVHCAPSTSRAGLTDCKWESDLMPSPGGNATDADGVRWLDVKTTRLNDTHGTVFLQGTNTRGCRLYFDKPIAYYKIHDAAQPDESNGATGEFLPGYEVPAGGVKEVRLWSREWDRGFLVEVGWSDRSGGDAFGGYAACEWAEYASAAEGGSAPAGRTGVIPALEEVKAFLPLWAQPSKLTDGLVEARTRFAL